MAFADRESFDCVEVMCWPPGGPDRKYGGVTHLDLSDFTQAMADDARAICERHGVAISALGYYSIPLSADRDQAEAAHCAPAQGDRRGADAGARRASTRLSAPTSTCRWKRTSSLFQQVWPDIVRHAEERGVRIGIENCPMLYEKTWPFGLNLARTPAIWRRMFEAIPSPHFGLNYDPSHLVMQLIDPIATDLRLRRPHLPRPRQGHAGRSAAAQRGRARWPCRWTARRPRSRASGASIGGVSWPP